MDRHTDIHTDTRTYAAEIDTCFAQPSSCAGDKSQTQQIGDCSTTVSVYTVELLPYVYENPMIRGSSMHDPLLATLVLRGCSESHVEALSVGGFCIVINDVESR